MSQTDLFLESPTILRMPTWLGHNVTQDHHLPCAVDDYKVAPGAGAEPWTVTLLKTGEIVYSGLGPVEILREHHIAQT